MIQARLRPAPNAASAAPEVPLNVPAGPARSQLVKDGAKVHVLA